MAIRFDAATDYLSRTTGMPAFSSVTATWWMYRSVDTGDIETLWYWSVDSAFSNYVGCYIGPDDILAIDSSGTYSGTAVIAAATWYRVAVVYDDAADTVQTFVNGVLDRSIVETKTFTPGYEHFGRIDTLVFNGRLAAFKMWTAALSLAELEQEWAQYMPVRTTNLHRVTPCLTHTDLVDYSGVTGVAWTPNGTLTTEDGPPIPWVQGRRRVLRPLVAAGLPDLTLALEEPAIQITTF